MARTHDELIIASKQAIKNAQDVRAYHRKRTKPGHPQRITDVANAMHQLKLCMRPVRSALGHAPYDPITETYKKRHQELREISKALQKERQKLWKLRGGKRYLDKNRKYKRDHGQNRTSR